MSSYLFQHMVANLKLCLDHMYNDLSKEEEQARKEFVRLCVEIEEKYYMRHEVDETYIKKCTLRWDTDPDPLHDIAENLKCSLKTGEGE